MAAQHPGSAAASQQADSSKPESLPAEATGESHGPTGPQACSASSVSSSGSTGPAADSRGSITYRQYRDESDLVEVMQLIDSELSEPYSIFTYRYFLQQWPSLCYFACGADDVPVATIVAKAEEHKSSGCMRGYIAMLVVEKAHRGLGIGTQLVRLAIDEMARKGCEEVVLEAETTNAGALAMYESLGFIRDKRLERYYLSGTDAFRLKLLLPPTADSLAALEQWRLQDLSLEEDQLRR